MLCDRRNECGVLDGLLSGARSGHSGVLLLRGEPGVGKTALIEHAIDSASDLRVVRVAGVESERELSFAGLHQLCAPMFDRLDRLPTPQRDALETTFGLRAGPVPDRFLVSLAVLSLLAEVAEERPLMCVVDDAQWFDRSSMQTLAFVARRLFAESVALLIAVREPRDDLSGLPELMLEGLPDIDARELLASVIPWRLDDRVREQIVVETRGNPLALLELPRGLSPAQLAGGFGLPSALPLSGRIEESFQRRLGALPEKTQRLLLIAASEPVGDSTLLWRAAERLGIAAPVVGSPESAGLLEIGRTVRFRHPLVRSAVYRAAAPEERRTVHAALAEVTDPEIDPDRRAWHLAEAAADPDDDVAAELERCASRAQARGGLAAAAAFMERAATLSVEQSRVVQRALAAAQLKFEAGSLDEAFSLLGLAGRDASSDVQLARVDLLRAQIEFASRRSNTAPRLLLKAARDLEALDPETARSTYLEAVTAALFAGRLAQGCGTVEVSQAALAAPAPPGLPSPTDLLLQGLAVRFTDGYAAGAPILRQALSAFRREAILPPEVARWSWLACWAASDLWEDETWTLLSTRQLEGARDAGALTAIPLVVPARSFIHAISGELDTAASLVEEMRAVTEATGIDIAPYGALWLAALRGRETDARELIETTQREALARGEGFALAATEFATAALCNGLGRYDEALSAVSQAAESSYEMGLPWAVPELIEAAVRCEQTELAKRALERLTETSHASATDWARGVEARSRALLSADDDAEALYREAIQRLTRSRIRLEHARAHLLYGEWLRHQERRADAREQLRTAHEMLAGMGAEAFAGRAERQLLANGEKFRKRPADATSDLTVQETEIARMARDGLSNPEIGTRLFLSPRTVEWHLRKVFHKLGISSRSQLSAALPREPTVAAG